MVRKFILKKLGQIVLHTIFWCGVLLFYTYFFGVDSSDFSYVLSFSLFLMPITIATTYVSIYKLIPDYLITKRYFRFGLYCFYTLVISAYLIVISVFFGLVYRSNFEYSNMAPISKNMVFVAISVYLVVIMVSAFKLLQLNLKHTEETKKLENKILETQLKLKEQELNYLKMQIHPHFLFNTLNTLYAFALNKNENISKMILQLSNLLDYILYQTQKPLVFLSEEIEHLRDYIDLEKNRFQDKLRVNFETKTINDLTQIPPMLFLPFLENSFKHGKDATGNLKIDILIMIENGQLLFEIANSKSALESEMNKNDSEHGIGLENIQKRLDLLYKNNYSLKIVDSEDQYQVKLILNLNTTE